LAIRLADLLVHVDRELGATYAEIMETAYCGILGGLLARSQVTVKTLGVYLGLERVGRTATESVDAKALQATAGAIWMPHDRDIHVMTWFERLARDGYQGLRIAIYGPLSTPSPYATEAMRYADASFHNLDLPGLENFLVNKFSPNKPLEQLPNEPDFWLAWRAVARANPNMASVILAVARQDGYL